MGMVVHGRASSSNVQAVMWGLAELGLSADRRDVGGRFGGNDTAEYLAMHPMGLVPVLQHGDVTMFESAAILRYLVEHHDPEGRLATTPRGQSWAEWAKATLCGAFTLPIFWAFYRTPEDQRDMSAVHDALRRFEDLAGIAMAERGGGPFMAGARLSLPDIWVGHVLYRYFTLDLPRQPPGSLERYYAALVELPGYREHVMVDYSELKGRHAF
ncbi:glutathione S-transferase [Aliiruegeria haliotis]|uniref:Glutathione S-transferase n=1 Tax=Aliiruegeria haliotis TaxID=1280846 RepID=A0A2T0RY32_9RHOB|nr:glutathione S-transferase N-terminal domain-containing protein [Aliiruegeria haliotis]PRY26094.1 glutathione S-transferase [Aliiruegeria haliotis]